MKITRIKGAKGFRSFNTEIDVKDLKNVNLIFGHNNTGKSNFLRLLHSIFSPKSEASQNISNFWAGIIEHDKYFYWNGEWENSEIEFELEIEILFTELDSKYQQELGSIEGLLSQISKDNVISIVYKGRFKSQSYTQSEIILDYIKVNQTILHDSKNGTAYNDIVDDKGTNLFGGFDLFEILFKTIDNSILFISDKRYFVQEMYDESLHGGQFDIEDSRKFKSWMNQLFTDLDQLDLFEKITKSVNEFKGVSEIDKLMNKTDKGNFEVIEKRSPFKDSDFKNFHIINMNNLIEIIAVFENYKIPLSSLGTGVQQIVYILSLLAKKSPKIVLLEELELNLSPNYQVSVIEYINKWASNNSSQAFLTTHSPFFAGRALDNRSDYKVLVTHIAQVGTIFGKVNTTKFQSRYKWGKMKPLLFIEHN